MIFMLNGRFSIEDIISSYTGHTDISSIEIINEFLKWGIITSSLPNPCSLQDEIKTNNLGITVHFPKISNINVIISMFLQKSRTKCVFYEDEIIGNEDINRNIYYENSNIGENKLTILRNKTGNDNVYLSKFAFATAVLTDEYDIVVNSDKKDWIDSERSIIINTWNYHHSRFEGSKIFEGDINISPNLAELVDNYVLATRSFEDIIHSIQGGQYS